MPTATSGLAESIAKVAPVGYLSLVVIAVDQLIQVSIAADSFTPAEPLTRFQLSASFAARMAPFILGFLIAFGSALAAGSRVALAALRWTAAGLAVILAGAAVMLWFDGATLKPSVGAEELSAFRDQWIRGQVFSILGSGFFAWFSIGLFRMR